MTQSSATRSTSMSGSRWTKASLKRLITSAVPGCVIEAPSCRGRSGPAWCRPRSIRAARARGRRQQRGWRSRPRSSRQSSPASTGLVRILGQDRVDLADGLRQALLHAHAGELLHGLDGGKLALDRHPGLPAVHLLDGHARGRHRELRVRGAVLVREAVAKDEPMRRLDLVHVPEAAGLIALRASHVVLDLAAGAQVVSIDRRWVRRRSPPALELARIGPELPDPLRRGPRTRPL